MNYRIILASQSPRRQELLRKMGLKEFRVVPSYFEEYLDTSLSAGELVIELARGKVSEATLIREVLRYPHRPRTTD